MGLPVGRTKIAVYSFSGFCSALAGIVFSISLLAGYGQFATGLELDTIASVVMGGTLLTGGVGKCDWHAVWRADRRHDHIDTAIQWHIELVVDPHWRRG